MAKGMSAAQTERVKAMEQFKAEPYIDGKGSSGRSVGYGFHLNAWPEKAKEVEDQIPLTKAQADKLFEYVDSWNAEYLAKKLGVGVWNGLDQRQIDALLAVAYNAGAPGVWRAVGVELQARNFESVASKLETHATTGYMGDKKVDLALKRTKEAEQFRAGSLGD